MADSIQLGIRITADGKGAESTINLLNKSIEKVGDSSKKAASGITGIEKATKGLSSAAAVAGRALATMGAAFSVRELVRTADAYAGIQARLKLVSGNVQELARAQGELFRISQQNLTPIQETVQLYSRLANAMREMGRSQQDTLRVTDLVGKAMRISGTDAAGAAAGILQFAQAIGAGVLRGDELNSTLENSPRLAKALADGLKVPISALRSLAEQGELTSDKVINALLSQADTLKREYSNIPLTVSGAFTQLENSLKTYIGTADQGSGASRELAESISLIAKNINTILDPFANMVSTMVQGWAKIGDSIKQVRIALGDLDAYRQQFGVNEAIGKDEWLSRGGGKGEYTTGGGFGGEMSPTDNKPFFDGINKTNQAYIEAANSAWRLNDAQKAVVATIVRIGQEKGFDPAFLLSIAKAETQLGNMKKLVSPTGAQGIFQFMPGTARAYGLKDPWNLEQSTNAAIKYLGKLKAEFKTVGLAAAGYNAGEGAVRKYGNNVPPYKETQTYVQRVLKNYQDLQQNMGKATDDISKEIAKADKDQYSSYVDHLKLREQAFDDYAKKAIAEQRTMMERLEIQRKAAEDQAKAAMASGDTTAIAKAEQIQAQFIQRKHDLLLQGIQIEEEATKKKLANIGMEIAQAQKLNQYQDVDKLRADRQSELAELAALAERRKQIEMSANADIAKNASEYEDQKRKAQQQAASDYAAQVAAQREITEAESDFFRQKMELVQQMQAASADARKQDIDGQLEQARNQAAISEADRQQAMQGKTGIEAMQLARENLNARLNDTINLIYMERDAALEKLRIDGDILFGQRQLLEVYKAIAEQNGDRKAVLDIEQKLEQVYASQSKNIRDRIQAMNEAAGKEARAKTDTGKDIGKLDTQEVKESQLRMNAFWDQYLGRLQDYANLWGQITGDTENGWSKMSLAAGEYFKQFNQIQQYWQSDAGKAWGDMAPAMEGIQQGQAALAGMAKTLIALRSNYKEGSQGYKDMTNAAERMMEVQRALAVVEGVMGVLHQLGSGDPYTAPVRAAMASAIVVGQLASIGMSAAAVGGFSNRQAREASQAGGSTSAGGGVFGDTTAQSESISKAIDIVAQNSSADLAYSAGMLRSLKNIELALAGTTNAIIRGVKPADVQGLGYKKLDPFDMLGIGKLIGSGVYTKITNWGIKALPQQLDQILAKGFQGMNWTEVTKSTKILGITISKSVKNIYGALDTGVTGQITRVIRGMADTVREAGKAFGISGDQFNDAMKGFVVNFGTLATKGLKGDELQKAVEQVFSSMSDDMAQQFQANFGLNLEPFMQAGEGMFQTLVRVSNGINTATGILAQAGLEAINYQQIVQKQGDVASEIVRQSIVAFEGVTSAIGAYVDQAVGSAEELMSVYRDLLIVSDVAKVVGFNLNDLTQALIVTSGGVSQFLSNLQTYQTEIAGGSDYARQIITLRREFAKLGESLPANNREFVKLVNGIDTSTEAGQRLYAQVIALADGFAKAEAEARKLDELRAKYRMVDPLQGYRDQLAQIDEDFKAINEGVIARMKGGPQYIKRTGKIDVLRDRIDDRELDRDLIQADIDELEAKSKLTAAEKQRLATLRQQRKELDTEIKAAYKQIAAIEELIKKNPNTENILKEKAALIEEQGNAILKTIADIWDQMTQNINAAKETLINIQNDIYELTFTAGSPSVQLGMATAKRTTAEAAYNTYTGDDIVKLREYADEYHRAIMEEYQARLDFIEAPKRALEKERDLAQKAHDEKIQALEKELGATKELADAVKSIQEYVKGLRLSSNSTLSPKKLLDEARKQYTETLVKAQGGDVEAMRQITGASDAYLDAARKYFGSGGKYGAIFDGVVAAMDQLGGTPTGDADSIQAKIDDLNKQHGEYLKGIEEKIAALKIEDAVRELQRETAGKLEALAKDLGPRITKAEEQAKKDMQTLIGEVIAQKVLNADQLQALRDIAKGIGIEGYQGATPTNPTIPAPTDDWVQDIFNRWNEGQTGYKPPAPAFGMSSTAGAMSIQSASPMPTYINDPAKPITVEVMPRYVNDLAKVWTLQDKQNQAAQSKTHDETIAALHELRTELRALVTTQSGANPQLIERLENIERRLAYMERDQKLKPA